MFDNIDTNKSGIFLNSITTLKLPAGQGTDARIEQITYIFASGNNTLASWVEKNKEKINSNINKLVDEILGAE